VTRSARRRPGGGWTLIETLVAVALTAVLAAVVLSTWMTVHRVLRGRGARVTRAASVADALRRMATDLECACEPASGPAFELQSDKRAAVGTALRFCSVAAATDGTDGGAPEMAELRYEVARDETAQPRMVRIRRPAAGPGAMGMGTTNALVARAEAISIEAFDGTNWLAAWPAPGGERLPRAVRISVAYGGASGPATARVETVVQAGVPVRPRIERRAAPASAR